jgi:hypothetical protein
LLEIDMFGRNATTRLGQSVLVAQKAVEQVLELIMGERVFFHDIEILTPNPEDVSGKDRVLTLRGRARRARPECRQFAFSLPVHMHRNDALWEVEERVRSTIMIEWNDENPREDWYVAYWQNTNPIPFVPQLVHVTQTNKERELGSDERSMWIVGTSLSDRHEEPLFPSPSEHAA